MDNRLKRHDLTEDEWVRLVPLLPAHPRRGHRWADHRMVINGVFFRARAACSWRSLPEVYGSWKTVYNRHRRWSTDGTWEAVLDVLRAGRDEIGVVDGAGEVGAIGRLDGAGEAGEHTPGRPAGDRVLRLVPPEDIRPWRMFEVANW